MNFKARYPAQGVAEYMIDYAYATSKPITNLQLQKMLYFAWCDYYRQTKRFLFSEAIAAWQYGHVVPSVYYEYARFSAFPLKFKYYRRLDKRTACILIQTVDTYVKKGLGELIDESRATGKSWQKCYVQGQKNEIPFDAIASLDCI